MNHMKTFSKKLTYSEIDVQIPGVNFLNSITNNTILFWKKNYTQKKMEID